MKRFLPLLLLAAVGCGTPAAPSVETTAVAFNPEGAPVVEFEAPGLHCENCAASLRKSLDDLAGVVDVKADADTKSVKVAINEAEFDRDAAVAAIAESGFGAAEEEVSDESETDAPVENAS